MSCLQDCNSIKIKDPPIIAKINDETAYLFIIRFNSFAIFVSVRTQIIKEYYIRIYLKQLFDEKVNVYIVNFHLTKCFISSILMGFRIINKGQFFVKLRNKIKNRNHLFSKVITV